MERSDLIFKQASIYGIKILGGTAKDKDKIGIHLYKPSLDELEHAIAEVKYARDRNGQYPIIFIHGNNNS